MANHLNPVIMACADGELRGIGGLLSVGDTPG